MRKISNFENSDFTPLEIWDHFYDDAKISDVDFIVIQYNRLRLEFCFYEACFA